MGFKLSVEKWNMVAEEGLPKDGSWCFYVWESDDGKKNWEIGGYSSKEHQFYVNYGLGGLVIDESDVVAWALIEDAELKIPPKPLKPGEKISIFKLELLFDKERVEQDQIYSLESLYEFVDDEILSRGLRIEKTEDGGRIYHDVGRNEDFCELLSMSSFLMKEEWFRRVVSKFVWYNGSDWENGVDFCVEDILQEYEKMGKYKKQAK